MYIDESVYQSGSRKQPRNDSRSRQIRLGVVIALFDCLGTQNSFTQFLSNGGSMLQRAVVSECFSEERAFRIIQVAPPKEELACFIKIE